jgi:hypothetical protein
MLVRWAEAGRVDHGLKPDLVSVRDTKTPVEVVWGGVTFGWLAHNTENSPLATSDVKDRRDAWSFAPKGV